MIELLGISAALLTLLAVTAWVADRWMDKSVKQSPRAYTGPVEPDADPWHAPVASYFGQRRDSDERVARAVDHVVYPEKRSGTVHAARSTTRKEIRHASADK